jgi:hypothetical protein
MTGFGLDWDSFYLGWVQLGTINGPKSREKNSEVKLYLQDSFAFLLLLFGYICIIRIFKWFPLHS